MNIPELLQLLSLRVRDAEVSGSEWAKHKAVYEGLEDKKKVLVASLMSKFEGTNVEKERQALASEEYKDFITGLKEARKSFLQSQVYYDMAKLKIDCIRTAISATKEEVKNFKG